MGDGMVIWFVAFSMNGLLFATVEPFNSEEACRLAGEEAHLYQFDCVPVPAPPGMMWESS